MSAPTTGTPAGTVAASNDASNRSIRTLVQGLAVDVLVALLGTAVTLLTNLPAEVTWAVIGVSLGKSAVQAALAYVMRVRDILPGLLAPVVEGTVVGQVVTVITGQHVADGVDDVSVADLLAREDRSEADAQADYQRPAD